MSTVTLCVSAQGPAPNHEVCFAECVEVGPGDLASAVVALLHLAVCRLNADCDEHGSVIAVVVNGVALRNIHGENLRELGRRTRAGVIDVLTRWWQETA